MSGIQSEICNLQSAIPRSGRRALQKPAKRYGQRTLEVLRVIMPERVTIKRVRIPFAESLRIPGEGKSAQGDRKSTRLNSSHVAISYAVFCLKKKKKKKKKIRDDIKQYT